MKPFHFQRFSIQQRKNVFRVGTDAVLLGILSSVNHAQKTLEIGTGTGIVSLMIAQRNALAEILALEINSDAVILAEENFKNAPFNERLQLKKVDFNNFESQEKFDLIISNPPYFEKNSSEKDISARQQTALTFEDLIRKSSFLLSKKGVFSVIIPFEEGENFENKCLESGLKLRRKIKIFGIKNSTPKRWILEFGFESSKIECKDFIIEESPRKYSDEYLELTKNFHVF